MSELLMVDVNPQVSVMFKDKMPVRVFIDININSAVDEVGECVERAKEIIKAK